MTDGNEPPAHILIVDDDPAEVLLLAQLLEPLGVIHVSTRANQALELAAAVRPDNNQRHSKGHSSDPADRGAAFTWWCHPKGL